MVEADPGVVDLTFQLTLGVAAGAQAGGVLDLGPRLDSVGAGDVFDDLIGRLELAHRLRFDAGRVVAFNALHRVVRRACPRIVVRLHDVAVVAEAGLSAVLDETDRADRPQNHHQDPNLNCDLQRTRETIEEMLQTGHCLIPLLYATRVT